jgi:hypothetical protein
MQYDKGAGLSVNEIILLVRITILGFVEHGIKE